MTKEPVPHTPGVHREFVEGARKLRAEAAATVDEEERAYLERKAQWLDDMLALQDRLLSEIDRLGEWMLRQRGGNRRLSRRRR